MKPKKASFGTSVSADNRIICITGLPRSGKSHLLKNKIIPEYLNRGKTVCIVDVNREYMANGNPKVFVYRIRDYDNAEPELETLITYLLKHRGSIDALIIDESNVILNKQRLTPNMKRLVNTLRHEKIDLVVVARRPVDINITISELANERYIFATHGYNDISRLNNIYTGLGDAAQQLTGHSYIYVANDREYRIVEAA